MPLKYSLFRTARYLDRIFHRLDTMGHRVDTAIHRRSKSFFALETLAHSRQNTREIGAEEISPRVFEYAFLIRSLPRGGRVLDVGCTATMNFVPILLSDLGYEVYATDLRPFKVRGKYLQFVLADARHLPFRTVFDAGYSVSAVEHIGLPSELDPGFEDAEGDIKAMEELQRILTPGGIAVLTVPFGRRDTLPLIAERVYDAAGLERLSHGLTVLDEEYVAAVCGEWRKVSQFDAGKADHAAGKIAVAMLKLRKPPDDVMTTKV
jgi:SAM-dependent methyltransferase